MFLAETVVTVSRVYAYFQMRQVVYIKDIQLFTCQS